MGKEMNKQQKKSSLFMSGKTEKQLWDFIDPLSITQSKLENACATLDQDWQNESTILTFDDGSKIFFSGPLISDESK